MCLLHYLMLTESNVLHFEHKKHCDDGQEKVLLKESCGIRDHCPIWRDSRRDA